MKEEVFLMKYNTLTEKECNVRGVTYNVIADIKANQILNEIRSPEKNQDIVRLEKVPKIAIYSQKVNNHGMML